MNDFHSTNETTSSQKNENSDQSRLHKYIHTYVNTKREKNEKTKTTTIITYNYENLLRLIEIAKRHKTSASAIISNFVDCFVEYFDEKPVTMDVFLDPDYIQTPSVTDTVEERILPFLKKQETRVLESIDINLFRAHVFARVLSKMNPEERKSIPDYLTVWRTMYK